MDKAELERRTKEFALRVIRFVAQLPKSRVTDLMGYQLVKSGTSIGANYGGANRAESRSDFIYQIETFGQAIGGRMVLNTSLNLKREPIIDAPQEA